MALAAGLVSSAWDNFTTADPAVRAFLWLAAIDYATGLAAAVITKEANSTKGFNGLLKKFVMCLLLATLAVCDRDLHTGSLLVRGAIALSVNEVLSIFENAVRCGIPLPEPLVQVLAKVRVLSGSSETKKPS